MRTAYSVKAPDDIESVITISATVGEFRKLHKLLTEYEKSWNWPLGNLMQTLQRVIADAERHFNSEVEKEGNP